MRAADRPLPGLVPHPIPPGAPVDGWPLELRIAVQAESGDPYLWDDGHLWDDTTDGRLVWDGEATDPVWVDAICDFQALQIDHGIPDELGLFPAVQLTLALDNRDGAWSTWTTAGRRPVFPVGTPVAVWCVVAGDERWLFSGHATAWEQTPGAVTVTAFDGFADLAPDMGGPWTPRAAGQRPLPRMQAIAAAVRFPDPVVGDTGHTDLLAPPLDADVSPLEAMQIAALSDGGVVAGDVDGQVLYRDRYWRTGRTDQARVPIFTDNACDAGALVVWDPVTGANDTGVTDDVTLTNTNAVTVTASYGNPRPRRLTHPDPDWWPDAGVGTTLAWWLLGQNASAGFRVDQFGLHLFDPHQPTLPDVATDLRRGDRFGWTSDTASPTGPMRLDLDVIVAGVRHDITPEDWLTTVYGTRAVGARYDWLWDDGHLWDDPAPANVWRP